MKKVALTICACLILLSLAPGRGFADEVADLQAKIAETERQRQALLEEQAKLQAQIDAAQKQGNTLKSTINQLQAAKNKIDNDLKVTQSNIDSATLTINKLTLTISQKQQQVAIHKQAIREGLQKLSAYDDRSVITSLLTPGGILDVWRDSDSINQLNDSLQNEIVALENAQIDLTVEVAQKQQKKTELASLKNQLAGQKQTVTVTQNAQASLLAQTKSQEANYQKLLADNIAREKQFEEQLFQYQLQLKVGSTSGVPGAKHGLLTWPLSKIVVTQQFGKTADSVRLYASGTHSGTDFGTPVGSAVMSVGVGVVAGIGNTDDEKGCYSYGRWLFITYDNGLSSIYGHLSSITVNVGDQVRPGQVVAYSGGAPGAYGSGYSTGPHLHMGLFNTAGVTIQKYSSSIGCKNVSMPLANPADYLDPMAYLPSLN